jgi:hypothetical protein
MMKCNSAPGLHDRSREAFASCCCSPADLSLSGNDGLSFTTYTTADGLGNGVVFCDSARGGPAHSIAPP